MPPSIKKKIAFILFTFFAAITKAENGYELWMRYVKVADDILLLHYKQQITSPAVLGNSPTLQAAKSELEKGLSGLLQTHFSPHLPIQKNSSLIAGTAQSSDIIRTTISKEEWDTIGTEGFILKSKAGKIIITANTDIGVLYGVFHFLKLLQTQQNIDHLNIVSVPSVKRRLLDHWDNLNGTVERGYAGGSIWKWHKLPGFIDKRYIDYARANASIGINGTVLNNVNSNAIVLTDAYLQKVKALADVFRVFGIKVYLSARFSAPMEIGGLPTADPLNEAVQQWWKQKATEIYSIIPDFGGFLVKANSEGQPGPQDYKRSHADGANMLAGALAPYGGIVIWRAFVYAAENPTDRHKQAFDDFVPLDGQFSSNVMVQVKNGAIDFMPREPFHPIFGSMPKTALMMEFQITQEYTGQSTSLVYLAALYKEVLKSDTHCNGKGSTVARIIDGSNDNHTLTGMAGVSNIGNDINWCGHPFAQANWYAFGRLCWNNNLESDGIAEEWIRMTFSNKTTVVQQLKDMMLGSRETLVNYMNPLGLHHIMGTGHHYGPAPWVKELQRPEWNPVYYHKADSTGIGFNRTVSGSNAIAQYHTAAQMQWNDIETCDEKLLLWFHHVPWNHVMKNGKTLWNELCSRYYEGAEKVNEMRRIWNNLKQEIDTEQFNVVVQHLNIQQEEAIWWRNACLLYFQTFSKQPIPAAFEQPDKTLNHYKGLQFPFAPGN